jgi:hypothetical protein
VKLIAHTVEKRDKKTSGNLAPMPYTLYKVIEKTVGFFAPDIFTLSEVLLHSGQKPCEEYDMSAVKYKGYVAVSNCVLLSGTAA